MTASCWGWCPKTHLPNYGEFYEQRWFAPAPEDRQMLNTLDGAVCFGPNQLFLCETMPELVVGCEICEDLWSPCPPSTMQALAGATVIVNLSASNEVVGQGRLPAGAGQEPVGPAQLRLCLLLLR